MTSHGGGLGGGGGGEGGDGGSNGGWNCTAAAGTRCKSQAAARSGASKVRTALTLLLLSSVHGKPCKK
eukprot:scaffold32506_cov61-Phaeocystis_antarctica.AAC.1